MDCDLCVPTFPCTTKYSGEITSIINYLDAERPVGWMEEITKLQDLSGSYHKPNMTNWPVKFRLISPGVVLPRQVSYREAAVQTIINFFLFPDLPVHG